MSEVNELLEYAVKKAEGRATAGDETRVLQIGEAESRARKLAGSATAPVVAPAPEPAKGKGKGKK